MSTTGRYAVLAQVGGGGMGTVHRAVDRVSGREVALKRIRVATRAQHRHAVIRFQREFHTLSSLAHPRIVRVHDYGVDHEGPYYTMELLGGQDLRAELAARGRLTVTEACVVLRDVASALGLLHARGLVHRDLTPSNIRIVDGRAVLFDFGVLMREGSSEDVAGTAAFVAPEVARGLPADGRADLYSLGVLAYTMLTGRRPFEVRAFEELEVAWRAPLPALSSLANVPEALEDLVHDLLCLDPLGRPASAALLVDRLTAIASLPPDPSLAVAPSIDAPAAMVGREEELAKLRTLLASTVVGGASSFYLEALSGTGKSRLLAELEIEAKLRGARVARVACEQADDGAPFAVLSHAVSSLVALDAEAVERAAGRDRATLARVLPALRSAVDDRAERDDSRREPAEERMRLQAAIQRFVRALRRDRPLVLLIDDVQRCDEASASSLASLARADIGGLMVGVALRLGEPVRAPDAMRALSRLEPRIALEGLPEAGVLALVRASFGPMEGDTRLAHRLHAATSGSPLHCVELLRALVERGDIRADAGTWIVREDAHLPDASERLVDAVARRLESLPDDARALGEALAVVGGQMSLQLALALAEEPASAAADPLAASFAALDALVSRGVLVERGGDFHFRHDSAREALLGSLSGERRRALHARAGAALEEELGEADDASRLAEIGWHLHRGGDARGATLLDRAGRRLYEAHAFADCIAPLEVAIEHLPASLEAPRAELSFMLLSAGWIADRDVGERYGERAIELWARLSGMDVALRWAPRIGAWLGLALGTLVGTLRWALRPGPARGPRPDRALGLYAQSVTYAAAVAYAANHIARTRAIARHAEPFRALKGLTASSAHLFPMAMVDFLEGRRASALARLLEVQRVVSRPGPTNPLTQAERRTAEAGARSMRAMIEVYDFDLDPEANLRAIDDLGLEYYRLSNEIVRAVRHRLRGEEAKAREVELAAEPTALQLGSWSTSLQRLLNAHPAYAVVHDVEGLKRCLDALERRCAEGMDFHARVALVRGELHRERAEHDEARALLEPALEALPPGDLLYRQWMSSCLALSELDAQRPADARRFADVGLTIGADEDVRLVVPWLRCQRARALADHALGEHEAAIARIEDAIRIAEEREIVPLAGELHEARARIAYAERDRLRFELHRVACARWLRPTGNPSLVAVALRLDELDRVERGGDDARRARGAGGSSPGLSAPTGPEHEDRTVPEPRSAPEADPTDGPTRVQPRGSSEPQ